jgi:hypothetical protein
MKGFATGTKDKRQNDGAARAEINVPHLFYVRNMFFWEFGYWPVSDRSGLG